MIMLSKDWNEIIGQYSPKVHTIQRGPHLGKKDHLFSCFHFVGYFAAVIISPLNSSICFRKLNWKHL